MVVAVFGRRWPCKCCGLGSAVCISKRVIEPRHFGVDVAFKVDANFWMAMSLSPVLVGSACPEGMYADVRRRHRGLEVRQVTRASAMGGVLLFFALLLTT